MFAGFVARMEDTRLPKCVMFGEMVGGAGCVGGQEKEWMGCFLNDLAFIAAIHIAMNCSSPCSAVLRHPHLSWAAVVHWSALMPKARRSFRVAQSKRARTGSLAKVD